MPWWRRWQGDPRTAQALMGVFEWVPYWAKERKGSYSTMNARVF